MVVATGFFDGVHIGHRFVIERLVAAAKVSGDESMVITFWPHPRNVLQSDARDLRLLSSLSEKKAMLEALGVDHIEVLPFTKEFSRLSTRDYLREYVIGCYGGKAIVLGYDNRLGNDTLSPDQIQEIAESEGLSVIRTDSVAIPSASAAGLAVSSTKIRAALTEGDVVAANRMLGYEYSMTGVVVAGNRLGRTIGFPTANLSLYEPLKLLPGNGVYHVGVEFLGRSLEGMCNIGVRPTISGGGHISIETNIFDFDEDIYGLDLRLSFLRRIRAERKFASLDALRVQLTHDRDICRFKV